MATFSERRLDFEGIPVHYVEGGDGFPVILLHGSGPGAASATAWPLVIGALASRFHVYAMDLVGFGGSGRKPVTPFFDVPLWVRQLQSFVGHLGTSEVGIIGHSLSGALALKAAATDKRITHLLTTCTAGGSNRLGSELDRIWTFPRNRQDLRRAVEELIYDQRLVTEDYLDKREAVLFSGDYAEYFGAMFSGDKQQYLDQSVVTAEELRRVRCTITMMHGRDDRVVPPEVSLELAASLPQADVVLLSRCKHAMAIEHPDQVINCASMLFPKGR